MIVNVVDVWPAGSTIVGENDTKSVSATALPLTVSETGRSVIGAWSALTVSVACWPAATVALPVMLSSGTVVDWIVVVADPGAPTA